MGIAEEADNDALVLPHNNASVPPKGDAYLINNLPPELLSRIFEVGLATTDSDTYDSSNSDTAGPFNDSEFPSLVSHVCRHWRSVACSTPSLWTTIVVAVEARSPYERELGLLERSKSLPIDISVNCDHFDLAEPPSDTNLMYLLSILTPHIHRWRTMKLTVSDYHLMSVFLSVVSGPSITAAPKLTTLELCYDGWEQTFNSFHHLSISSKSRILFGGSVPLLTKLVLWGVPIDWNQQWIASAPNLTDLELTFHEDDSGRPLWTQFVTILHGAPALKKLYLRHTEQDGDPFIEPTLGSYADLSAPIPLVRLTHLVLSYLSEAAAVKLLRRLYLPALKNLALDFRYRDGATLVRELTGPATSLSLPSAPAPPRSLLSRLESFTFGVSCSTESIEMLYGELQDLTSLNISVPSVPQSSLDILCAPCRLPGRGEIWLPRLVKLYLGETPGHAIREVVQKRRDMGVPLTSLYVSETTRLDDEDMKWLRENVQTFQFFNEEI